MQKSSVDAKLSKYVLITHLPVAGLVARTATLTSQEADLGLSHLNSF